MYFPKKLKIVRNSTGLTQEEFAKRIGVSRSNIANLELGNVEPTKLLINCISLTFDIKKDWLSNDEANDLQMYNQHDDYKNIILENYEKLDDKFKEFVSNQIEDLIKLQEKNK